MGVAPATAGDAATRPAGAARSAKARVSGVSLYAAREPIYQREANGPWQRLRTVVLFALAGFYVALPWLQWNGRQAVWFDVPARSFYLFGLTFWPQDFIYLSWLLILAAFGLFFFTNLAGRLWCGYACPQTVWTRFFMWIEWLTEGDRNRRILLDRGPWNRRKILRKTAKHTAWLAFSAMVGVTFVGYFLPVRDLVVRIVGQSVSGGEWVFLAVASLALYVDAGFMREQICKYACPYARFQGAMFDRATLTIFYDAGRGEPRGHRRRDLSPAAAGLGDCIDCRLCVHVCPTGIDIRQGTQFECIGCAACIDACDSVMHDVGLPKGLVRYTTESALAGKPLPLLRPRVVGYGAVLLVVACALAVGLARRMPLDVDVLRDRTTLYREVGAGLIENVYTLKVMNKSQQARTYRVSTQPPFAVASATDITVAAGKLGELPVRVRIEEARLDRASTSLTFAVQAGDDPLVRVQHESRFLAPAAVANRSDADDRANHGH
ncbi:MAG TPA: cytochrome c oxidase accessory protein CcoG [Candidatus Binatia bacterium]|jgi:cytochrome c oxidase accessory protein FixG